jgi:hypothetical protein
VTNDNTTTGKQDSTKWYRINRTGNKTQDIHTKKHKNEKVNTKCTRTKTKKLLNQVSCDATRIRKEEKRSFL